MVNSQPIEEGTRGTRARGIGTETHRGPTEPVLQTQKTPSPSPAFIKENINVSRTMINEHDQQAKTKATPRRLANADSDKEASARSRRLEDQSRTKEKTRREMSKSRGKRSGHQETRSDSEYEKSLEDTYEDMNSPYKIPKSTPFTKRTTRFKYHQMAKLRRNIRVYEGNKYPKGSFKYLLGGGRARRMADARLVQNVLLNPWWSDRRSYGLRKAGPSGKGYLPKQPKERKSSKEQHKVINMIREEEITRGLLKEKGRKKMVPMEFAIVKCRSPYNVIIGRTGMRSLTATVGKGARFMKRGALASM
nr:hypothetical protein [Tanacetum cinerariifolium]